jgi:uncharacterized protein (TIGR03437 family)
MIQKLFCLMAAASIHALAQAPLGYTIDTFAGNGTPGFSGDGGAATDAQLNNPSALAIDSSGNVFLSDQLNSRIRKISGGTISTVAGNGTKGYFGDTGQATSAGISYPQGIAVDSSGNLLISDTPNHGIRKVATGGVITTVAGGSYAAFDGDGGAATSAHINQPMGIAVDAQGNYYFSDSLNVRVRKVTSTGTISTYAGNGTYGELGDGGPATSAQLNNPTGLAVDAAGNLYICDTNGGSIRKVSPDGTITTVAGIGLNGFSGDGGPAINAMLNRPRGVAVDSAGLIYIADTFNNRIRVISTNGTISTIAGNSYVGYAGDGGPATAAILKFPSAVAVGPDGRIYIADTQNSRIRVLTAIRPTVPPGPPAISANGVVTALSYGGAVSAAPGSWVEIYGTNLAGNTRQWTAAEFAGPQAPTSLDSVSVTIGGKPAFVSFISPGQINVQVPSDVGTGPQQLIVSTAAGTSPPFAITINAVQAGLLAPLSLKAGDRQYAAGLLADGRTYVLPTSRPGIPARPARPGETVTFYGVGFGPTDPATPAGTVTRSPASITAPLQLLFAQSTANVTYAGLVPGVVGLYQFNVVVPNVADSDAVPLTFTVGGRQSTQTLFTAVRQ